MLKHLDYGILKHLYFKSVPVNFTNNYKEIASNIWMKHEIS